jgi:hypothetical protein
MPFQTISRTSLELLNQNYRSPGVLPRPVPPGRGDASTPDNLGFRVADEFIRVVPFVNADMVGRPHPRQYQVRSAADLFEPDFTARPAGSAWVSGRTTGYGQELELVGARFKKISTVVRSDPLMLDRASGDDMLSAQIILAEISIVRALSEALLHSVPASDDATELAGLPFFLPPGGAQDVAYDAGRRLIGGLAEIEARCCPSDGDFGAHPDVFIMASRTRWRLLKELEDKGVTPDFQHSPITGRIQFHYHGIPVLTGRVAEPAAAPPNVSRTTAWALKLYGPSGIRVLHLGGDSTEFGVRNEPMTTMTGFDAAGEAVSASRGVEVFGVYSVLVPEPMSIARLNGIPTADPFTAP